ncbi:OsmC family protein [Falsiroseomonas oryziterrae]|uniref:OsmC family protein n=1 Tax=Falsiroseomonas oryziterrae TaxID=2911368 RepID=UPI0023514ED2|nr:OsmC family protein [Roseomonas sp. NPKOSM-4]
MSPSRTLRCRTVAGGCSRLTNHIRDLPPIIIDQPGGLPGPDPAHQPLDLLLAALGSCLAAAIRTGAVAQGITLSGLALDVEAELAAARMDDAHPPPLGFDEVRVAVHINADAPRDALAALVARATLRSQVASTLHDGTQLSVALSSLTEG